MHTFLIGSKQRDPPGLKPRRLEAAIISNPLREEFMKENRHKFKGHRIHTIGTEKGEERRKSRTQREEAAHAGNSDGRRRQRRGRERMDSQERQNCGPNF